MNLPPRIKDASIKPVNLSTAKMSCNDCGHQFLLSEILPEDFANATRIFCPCCLAGDVNLISSQPH